MPGLKSGASAVSPGVSPAQLATVISLSNLYNRAPETPLAGNGRQQWRPKRV